MLRKLLNKKTTKNINCKMNKNLTLKKLLKDIKCKINKNLTLKKSLNIKLGDLYLSEIESRIIYLNYSLK